MLVVLPTYRRLDQLEWSLRSVFEADLPADDVARLRVISNFPPGHEDVSRLVFAVQGACSRSARWDVDIVRREKTLDPITNWYSAIAEHSQEGEIVFLHGDDDIILPWGLVDRWKAMQEIEASILLSPFAGNLLFSGEDCYPPTILEPPKVPVKELAFSSPLIGTAPFIGSHCYRFDEGYRKAFQLARQWCSGQRWMEEANSTLFIPLYLPLAALVNKTGVAGLEEICVVRGAELAEVIEAPYACRSWNNAYLYGGVFDVLTSPPLGDEAALQEMRRTYLRGAARGYLTLLFDHRLDFSQKWSWMKRMSVHCFIHPVEVMQSLRLLISEKLRLRRIRMHFALRNRRRIPTREWMGELRARISTSR